MSSQDPVPGTPDDQPRSAAPADAQPAGSHQAPSFGQDQQGREQHAPSGEGRPQAGYQPGTSQPGPYQQGHDQQGRQQQDPYQQGAYQGQYQQDPYQQGQQPFGAQAGPGRQGAGQETYAQGNYGQATFRQGAPLSPGDARTWALVSHIAAPVLNLVSAGWVGFLAPLILWFVFKDRDPLVRNAAAGAFNFNLIVAIVNIALWIITAVTLGIGVIITAPLLFIVWVVTIVFAVQGAVQANRGRAYRYPMQIPVLT